MWDEFWPFLWLLPYYSTWLTIHAPLSPLEAPLHGGFAVEGELVILHPASAIITYIFPPVQWMEWHKIFLSVLALLPPCMLTRRLKQSTLNSLGCMGRLKRFCYFTLCHLSKEKHLQFIWWNGWRLRIWCDPIDAMLEAGRSYCMPTTYQWQRH
jgi:hypothetical protein